MSYTYLFKYIVIGDSSVGKSCILLHFLEKKFKMDHDTTIGVEFGSKIIQVEGKSYKLQVWDTAGQESFKSITRSYYRGSICCVLVYDVTNEVSFTNLARWLEETKTYANDKITVILVGNKADLNDERVITYEVGKEFAQKYELLFIETSAKTGHNIEQSSEVIVKRIANKEIDGSNESLGIKIGSQLTEIQITAQKEKKKNCC